MKQLYEIFKKGTRNMQSRNRTRERIRKAEEYLKQLSRKTWVELFLEPLVEELKPYFPGRKPKILGPFGLGNQTTIYFIKEFIDPDSDEKYEGDNCYYLTLSPVDLDNGVFEYIDPNSESIYPENSLGRLNGLGCRTYTLPTNSTVEHFASLFESFKTHNSKQKEV